MLDYDPTLEDEDVNGNLAQNALVDAPTKVPGIDDSSIQEARRQRDEDMAAATLVQGLTQIGAGIAGTKADTSAFEAYRKNAQSKAAEASLDEKTRAKAVADYIKGKKSDEKVTRDEKYREENLDVRRKQLDADESIKRAMLGLKQEEFKNRPEKIPEEARAAATTLASKTANKESIANQIDAVMGTWDKLSEGERLQQGRQLIKVLNSSEGQDAVGAEESKRLAGKLEFALGNLAPWNNNPIQFGRDLEGFRNDAAITSKVLRDAAKANATQVANITGRSNNLSSGGASKQPKQRKGKYAPGSIVKLKDGSHYLVGADGDSLERVK